MTDQDERLERLAESYATHQGFPRKGEGDCRDSYDTLMKYEVRSYVSDAWLAGYKAALESEKVREVMDILVLLATSGHIEATRPDLFSRAKASLARFRRESK